MDKKKILLFIIPILLLVLLAGGTYAWYSWSTTSEDETVLITTGAGAATVYFNGGSDITDVKLIPTATKEEGIVKKITVRAEEETMYKLSFNLYLDVIGIDEELKDASYKYAIYKNDTLVKEGNFSQDYLNNNLVECNTNNTNHIVLIEDDTITTALSIYTLYLWIDGNMDNSYTMGDKLSQFKLHAFGENAVMEKYTFVKHISNLYISGNPTLITHSKDNGTSDTYYYSYQDDTNTWGLMNDGLTTDTIQDATTTGLAKVVTDTTALTSGTEGNIRYFGPSDSVKNYIYFNCNDYNNQSLTDANGNKNCELWRIIGIVDGKVKIIKNDNIGNLAWDQDKNQNSSLTTSNNNWTTSSLQEFLNGLYYNRGDKTEHTYLSGSSGTTQTPLDLESIGITEATRNNNLISESTWYLGGSLNFNGLYPNDIYNCERQNIVGTTIYDSNPFTINTNIGLMYASDYSYGTDLTKCGKNIYGYSSSDNSYACRANNWLFNNAHQWSITPRSKGSDTACFVISYGYVNNNYVYDANSGVRPVLYLNSGLVIESGHEGTNIDPYRISV